MTKPIVFRSYIYFPKLDKSCKVIVGTVGGLQSLTSLTTSMVPNPNSCVYTYTYKTRKFQHKKNNVCPQQDTCFQMQILPFTFILELNFISTKKTKNNVEPCNKKLANQALVRSSNTCKHQSL